MIRKSCLHFITILLIISSITIAKAEINGSTTYKVDVNQDGIVSISDLVIISQHFDEVTKAPYPPYDVNEDGIINILDITLVGQQVSDFSEPKQESTIPKPVRLDFSIKPSTDQIINQLILDISALVDPIEFAIKPEVIRLDYTLDGKPANGLFIFNKNSSKYVSIGEPVRIDLKQNYEYPYENYSSTILISSPQDKNITDTKFFVNVINKNMTIDSWGDKKKIDLTYEGDRIDIKMERVNRDLTIRLYWIGIIIIATYFLSFIFIYWKSPLNSDMFSVFNSFSFLFFVALVFAGIRDHIFDSIWGKIFFGSAFFIFLMIIIKRYLSRKENIRLKTEEEKRKTEIITMLKFYDEKITDLKELVRMNNERITKIEAINTELIDMFRSNLKQREENLNLINEKDK